MHWNEELKLPQHWNFDAHLIDGGWNAPRPVQACPTGALRALKVTDEEMQRIVETEVLVPLEQNGGHRPRVHYRNLYRFTHLFAAGTVFADQAAIETCIADAHVTLLRAETTIAEVKTDAFGDFRFDALPPLSGKYRVEIAAAGYRSQAKDFDLADNCWFGEIKLEPM